MTKMVRVVSGALLLTCALVLACEGTMPNGLECEGEVCRSATRPTGASGTGEGQGGDPSKAATSSGGTSSQATPSSTPVCPLPQGFVEEPLEPKPASPVPVRWHLNHLGYGTTAPKVALVEAAAPVTKFQLVSEADGRVRDAGALREVRGVSDWGGGPFFAVAEFSKFREVGRFHLRVQGQESEPFDVGPQVLFRATGPLVLQYFRNSRADERNLATWTADGQMGFPNRGERRNVQGGWYDASGDVSKYLSHLSYANFLNPQQIPLTAWALAWVADEGREVVRGQGLEQATVEEALWGADFLVRMQDPEGYFYATVFDGWSGKPESRQICAFDGEAGQRHANYQAAFREGGGLAIAALARISRWNKDGAYPSFHYLAVAEQGFRHLVGKKGQYCDDGRENVLDDYAALLAATELFRATDKAVYLDHARKRVESLAGKLHASGYFLADGVKRPFWHGSDAGLPLFSLVLYAAAEPDAGRRTLAEGTAQRHLSYLLEVTETVANPYGYARQSFLWEGAVRHGFFMPHENESGYWWQGENARLASLAAAVLVAGRRLRPDPCAPLGVEEAVGRYALAQVDWILGKNPYDVSFLEGVGRRSSPPYCSLKFNGHLPGGIANGITGLRSDGSGLTFDGPTEPEKCWQQWRWREQWLPHATWYWVALTALTLGEGRP